MAYDDTNRGFLMRNSRKQEGSKQPDFTGNLDVGGKKFRLSAWIRESKAGRKFFSIAVTPADEGGTGDSDLDDALPNR